MKSTFNKKWVKSTQPRRQRKYRKNAPLHIRRKMLAISLSKDLRAKYKRRSAVVIKGDKVKIMRGKFKGVIGDVSKVNYGRSRVFITGAELAKKDGPKIQCPIYPSNLQMITPKLDDKKRIAAFEKNVKVKKG